MNLYNYTQYTVNRPICFIQAWGIYILQQPLYYCLQNVYKHDKTVAEYYCFYFAKYKNKIRAAKLLHVKFQRQFLNT